MSLHADPPPPVVYEPNGTRYLTSGQLGKGGFAICYRGEQCEMGQSKGKTVALKIVRSQMEPKKLAQKFITELQLHSKLQHPNIVEFYRAFSFQSSTYVVLEICTNGSLADALKRRKFFTMPEIRRFIIQTCGAVKYLHERNIVHRDLKTGNLFLDHDMNIKVGDFGLAAMLVGKNEMLLRRTTMCGTPNYLAPEILEKSGKGHSEKVDLWAIGIIAYTLAVGRAPFHSSKREEIYQKLQKREYDWPDLAKHQNEISNDLRDLVGMVLVDEEERPSLDALVAHTFFKTAFIPDVLDSSCTTTKPTWTVRPPNAETLRRGFSDGWVKLCRASGVGEYAPGCCFPAVGGAVGVSIYKDVEKELKAGKQPEVPIPDGTVYLPFVSTKRSKAAANNLSQITEESSGMSSHLVEISVNSRSNTHVMVPVPTNTSSTKAASSSREASKHKEVAPKVVAQEAAMPAPRRTRSTKGRIEAPKPTTTRSVSQAKARRLATEPAKRAAEESQPLAPRAPPVTEPEPVRVEKPSRVPTTTRSRTASKETKVSSQPPSSEPDPVVKPPNPMIQERPIRPRTTRTISRQEKAKMEQLRPEQIPLPDDVEITPEIKPEIKAEVKPRKQHPPPAPSSSSSARSHPLSSTDPTYVLARATELRNNLINTLQQKSTRLPPSSLSSSRFEPLPFVSKWVDYSKKHGIGYVLADGSIGCVLNAKGKEPVTHVVARNGVSYINKPFNDSGMSIAQVPMNFYTQAHTGIIERAKIDSQRKKATAILWAKFGRYMCQTLTLGDDKKETSAPIPPPEVDKDECTVLVRFYQRLGTVGVWGFSNGCFQFNFPDHTKLVISSDAKFASFTCLPLDAVAYIDRTGDLPVKYIRHREVLNGSVAQLLRGVVIERLRTPSNISTGSDAEVDTLALITANLLSQKLEFVAKAVALWVSGRGLGCKAASKSWPKWQGPCLEDAGGKKVDWITVGRFGGDERRGEVEAVEDEA